MAINVSYEVLVASSVSDDTKANILRKVIQVLSPQTLAVTTGTYSAGASSTSQTSIEVGGASEDWGIRVVMDSAVVGTTTVAKILRRLIQVLEGETLVLVHTASYTAGSRTYNALITVT